MSPADRTACEDTMRGWYAENWYTRPDPADRRLRSCEECALHAGVSALDLE